MIGIFLTDIVFLEEGNPDFYDGKDINFEKVVMLGQQLVTVQFFQRCSYTNLVKEKENAILKYLTNLPFFTEEKLEKLSNDIKPIPADYRTKEKIEIEFDSAEVQNEDDSWSEDTVSENDFEDISSTSTSDDNPIYREALNEDDPHKQKQ